MYLHQRHSNLHVPYAHPSPHTHCSLHTSKAVALLVKSSLCLKEYEGSHVLGSRPRSSALAAQGNSGLERGREGWRRREREGEGGREGGRGGGRGEEREGERGREGGKEREGEGGGGGGGERERRNWTSYCADGLICFIEPEHGECVSEREGWRVLT